MPRRSRMYLSGLPYHIVQRGNNREACFFAPEDYEYYLQLLSEALNRYSVNLHAYVLMTNHVHFLATPSDETGISNVMKVVGSRYAQYINKTYQRTGTMWEGRHKSSVVDTDNYLLKCYRYIELNPVTALMVERPEEYVWSSYNINAYGENSDLIFPHDEYLKLGNSNTERCFYYRELFSLTLSEHDLHEVRKSAHYCQPLGSDRFREQIEVKSGKKLGHMKRGRPRKAELDGLVT